MLFKRGGNRTVATSAGAQDEETAGASTTAAELKSESENGVDDARKPPPMTDVFSWQHLNYTIAPSGGEHRTLLNDVSGYVMPGKLTALMGESGAGKVRIMLSSPSALILTCGRVW
jgi:ATP-binding cassette subfamily G (WHITE) protein 2 (SNQ2)